MNITLGTFIRFTLSAALLLIVINKTPFVREIKKKVKMSRRTWKVTDEDAILNSIYVRDAYYRVNRSFLLETGFLLRIRSWEASKFIQKNY